MTDNFNMPDEPTFPRLTDFPLEIQFEIWKQALPSKIKPCLFPYAPGCWERVSNERDEMIHHDEDLPGAPYHIPVALVNRLSFETAVRWLKKNNFYANRSPDKTWFFRHFDPSIDALFFPSDMFHNTICWDGDAFEGRPVARDAIKSRVRFLAVDDKYFYTNEWPCLLSHCEQWPSLEGVMAVIYNWGLDTVVGELIHQFEDSVSTSTDDEDDMRWEMKPISDGKFVWNAAKMEYEFKGAKHIAYPEVYAKLEKSLAADAEALKEDAADGLPIRIPDGFFVQPVRAVLGD